MKHIVIIGSRDSGKKNNPNILASSFEKRDATVTVVYWEDVEFTIAVNDVRIVAGQTNLLDKAIDLVIAVGWYKNGSKSIYRDIAYSLALALRHHGISFWNSEMGQQRSVSKLSCMMQLALNGIAVPLTRFSLYTSKLFSDQTLPFIAKSASASRGNANFLVREANNIHDVLAQPNPYLVQPYIENDHDLRIICFNAYPVLALRRERAQDSNTHLNNTSQGGHANWIELSNLSDELLTICNKICIIMGREMAGIDFIPDPSVSVGYSCLEVNAIPQLTSGFDIDKKLNTFVDTVLATKRRS